MLNWLSQGRAHRTKFKNWAALDHLGSKFDQVSEKVEGSLEAAAKSEADRAKIRIVLGSRIMQEALLKWPWLLDGNLIVERFFAWLQWRRRLLVRWEYYPRINFLGFVQLAAICIFLCQFLRVRDRF